MLSRGVIRVTTTSVKFLQGLISQDVVKNRSGYGGFFNAQGRLLYDVFVVKEEGGQQQGGLAGGGGGGGGETLSYLIDCDGKAVNDIVHYLQKFNLRKKESIVDVSADYKVFSSLFTGTNWEDKQQHKGVIAYPDSRHPQMGMRIIAPSSLSVATKASLEDYKYHRYGLGIGEGVDEFVPGELIPMEVNFDLNNGIDWKKGCYIGQELAARTHFKGVVRKRLIPLIIQGSTADPTTIGRGSDVMCDKEEKVGKVVAVLRDRVLAIVRLDAAVFDETKAKSLSVNGVALTPSVAEEWKSQLKKDI